MNRVPITRRSGNSQSRRAPVKRRTRRDTGFSPKVKLQARTRAGNGDPDEARCEATGVWLGRYGGEIQHRDARGMGGTSNPVTNSIVNAVLLSKEAHRLAESRDAHMNAMGFWLRNGQDPRTEPIRLHGGGTAWLAPDGRYLFEAPKGSVAA